MPAVGRTPAHVVNRPRGLPHASGELLDGRRWHRRTSVVPRASLLQGAGEELLGIHRAQNGRPDRPQRHTHRAVLFIKEQAQAGDGDHHGVSCADFRERSGAADYLPLRAENQFVRTDHRLLRSDHELMPRQRASTAGVDQDDLGVVCGQHRERVTGRTRRAEVPADGSPVADLWRAHGPRRLHERGKHRQVVDDPGIRDPGAEKTRPILLSPHPQLWEAADVQERGRPPPVEVQLDHNVGPASNGQSGRGRRLHLQRFLERAGQQDIHDRDDVFTQVSCGSCSEPCHMHPASAPSALPSVPPSAPVRLAVNEITKTFPGVTANDRVTMDVRGGEVHALLGENGAGKTTLMNILYGLYQPDAGEIVIDGRAVRIRSPRDAIAHGIGMVPQHFLLVRRHTVAENITLGLAGTRFFLPTRDVERQINAFAERYGLRVDPRAAIWQLSVSEQQRVEILKALLRGAGILILDEPTSVLTPQEATQLFAVLRRMKEEGKSVIFITHKLDEVMAVVHRQEIFGIAGVAGNGQRELVEALTGLRPVDRGRLTLGGRDVSRWSPRAMSKLGVAHIPEERVRMGIVPPMTVTENAILRRYEEPPFSRGPLMDYASATRFAQQLIVEYSIQTPSPRTPARLLSGGNIQKLILARELAHRPDLIIAAHPTYGLDVSTTDRIHRLLLERRDEGAAVLLVSEDLDEIRILADRIGVMYGGELIAVMPAGTDRGTIGLLMAGQRP